MPSVYRICYQPVFEGQDEEVMPKPEEGVIECAGVMADSLEEAMRKVREEYEGVNLEWAEEVLEELGAESTKCIKLIIIEAKHLCTIDLM